MKMFEDMADKIFAEAGVEKEKHPDLWQQVVDVLRMQMAVASATMRLSRRRVDFFEEQKRTLVNDLREMKSAEM